MAVTPWVARGTLTTTLTTTLYTVTNPADVIVTNIILTNKTASAATATIDIDGVYVVYGMTVAVGETVTIDLKQPVITSGSNILIRGGSGTATAIDYHIAGVSY